MEGIKDVAPKLGVAAAAGKVAAEAFKHTSGMALLARLAVVGSAAAVTAGGTMIGLELGKQAIENTNKKTDEIATYKPKLDEIATSKPKLDEINKDGQNSPSELDSGFIQFCFRRK
jgi:hypothetical protein